MPSQQNPPCEGGYRLEVRDFGPIARANIDMRPLTVFVGPSNTGKSYLAILLYALHQCFGGPAATPYRQRLRRHSGWPVRLFGEAVRPKSSIRRSLKDWLSKGVLKEDSLPAVPPDIVVYTRSILEQASGLNRHLEYKIPQIFGTDGLNELVRRQSSQANINIGIPQKGAGEVRYQFEFGQKNARLSGQISETILPATETFEGTLRDQIKEWAYRVEVEDEAENDVEGEELDYLLTSLVGRIFASLLQTVRRNAYYLPAGRTGVMDSHRALVSAVIQNAATVGPHRLLSGVLADFLQHLAEMPEKPTQYHKQARRLEQSILQGTIRMKRSETNYPIFVYRPHGWKDDLPLMRTSSMVSELASVVLYLRYLVRPGDVLIIEEPEAHLHPAIQTAFARELARLVRSGIRIVITTHSEWFLEQIGNLVRLSTLPEDKRTGIEGADVALGPDEVGAWLFKPKQRPKGSVVEEVVLDPETGLFPTDYDTVSETLYNESAEIFNRSQEGAVE